MTQSLPKSFNPFVTHSFTNGSGLTPSRSALPPSHPAPLPSPHLRTHSPKTISPRPLSDSNPSPKNSTPMHSPMPRGPPLASPPQRQIFEQFRKDAPTPELVLRKALLVKSNVVSAPSNNNNP